MPSSIDLLEIAGYKVLSLSLPPVPSFPGAATHYLYVAQHEPKIPSPTASRSLFLVNVPFDATGAHIKHLFSVQLDLAAGRIEDVEFNGRRKGDQPAVLTSKVEKKGRKRKRSPENGIIRDNEDAALPSTWDRDLHTGHLTAIILFVDRASMSAALKAVKSFRKQKKEPVWGEGMEGKAPSLGSARYLHHHQLVYPNTTNLLESVNSYMTAFAAKEAAEVIKRAKQRQEADADGFVTVTRGGRTNPPRQEAAQELAAKQKEKHKGLEDFYRFQSREKNKARAGELLKKFEEDKARVRAMRQNRRKFRGSAT